MEQPAPAGQRGTTHVLVPCRSDAATHVRQRLARDLTSWQIDAGIAEGLQLAAAEAVLNTVAAGGQTGSCMLIVAWTLGDDGPDGRPRFRFSVDERGAVSEPARTAAMRGHPSAMRSHPAVSQRRCVMDALMDRVVVNQEVAGMRTLLEKTLPGSVTA